MRMKQLFLYILFIALFSSCATTIKTQVVHPPLVDMLGVKKIAVVPIYRDDYYSINFSKHFSKVKFRVYSSGDSYYSIAKIITNELISNILKTNSYTLIDSSDLFNSDDYDSLADVFIVGEINDFIIKDSKESYDTDKGKKYYYKRFLALDFSYRYIRVSNGEILRIVNKSESLSVTSDEKNDLENLNSMAKRVVKTSLSNMYKELIPWKSAEERVLAKDKMKDPQMKGAEVFIKNKNYRAALRIYNLAYAQTGNIAAGYNEAIVTEILDGLPKAIKLMETLQAKINAPDNYLLYDAELDKKIKKELARMKKDYNESQVLKNYSSE